MKSNTTMEAPESELSSTSITMQEKEEGATSNSNVPSIMQEDKPQATQSSPVETPKKPFKFKVTVFMLCLISVVVAMDSVIVAATLPAIAVSLKGTSLEAFCRCWGSSNFLFKHLSLLKQKHVLG